MPFMGYGLAVEFKNQALSLFLFWNTEKSDPGHISEY